MSKLDDTQAAETVWTVDEALKFIECPDSVTNKAARLVALEVRRLRMEAIDARQKIWDWQRRALEAEEKLADVTHEDPTI